MLKCAEKLVKARGSKTIGNHSVCEFKYFTSIIYNESTHAYVNIEGTTRSFKYHGHTICVADDKEKKFYLSHAGWWTSSTKRALASYRAIFEDLGYENVWNTPIYNYECK